MATDRASRGKEAVFVDTNVLIYATVPTSKWHKAALLALEQLAASSIWISNQALREFLVHATRPDVRGTRTALEIIEQAVRLSRRYRIAEDSEAVREILLKLITQHDVQGKQVHDANIAATCVAYRIPRLLTHNTRDFTRFADPIEIVPLVAD